MNPADPLKTPAQAADWCRSVAHSRIIPDHYTQRLREIEALLRAGQEGPAGPENERGADWLANDGRDCSHAPG